MSTVLLTMRFQTKGAVPLFVRSTQMRVFVDPDLLQYDGEVTDLRCI